MTTAEQAEEVALVPPEEVAEAERFLVRRALGWERRDDVLVLELEAVRCSWTDGPIRPVVLTAEPPAEQLARTNTPNLPPLDDRPPWSVETTTLTLAFVGPRTLRLTLGDPSGRDFGMLVQADLPSFPFELEQHGELVRIRAGELVADVSLDPFDLRVRDAGGRSIARLPLDDLDVFGLPHAPSLALSRQGRRREATISLALEPNERLYGLGERFGRLDRLGTRAELWAADAWGVTTNATYKPAPVILSSRGYGLFLHTPARAVAELGSRSLASFTLTAHERTLDLFLFAGPSPKGVLADYTELTGRAPIPPPWVFGVWMSRCRYQTQAEVERVAERLRAEDVPADVIHIDPAWLQISSLNCDFEWDCDAFPDPEGMLRRLGELGFKVSLWEIPYIDEGTPSYREAANRGFLLTAADGRPIHPDAIRATDGRPRGIPDLTNPDARRWWKDKHRPLLRQGVAAFKTDFGEGVPAEARFWDGVDGVERHNLFPLLYNRTVAEVTAEETGRVGFVWGRSAWAGSQRYPGQWGGDPQTSVAAMAATLRGGLSYALSCPGIWSHDIGGFYGPPPSPALYVRWAQFGMLSPLARAHGTTPREPWEFGERACAIFRDFARLRYRLLPYLMHCAEETAREGLPMLRPVLLEFPDDPATATIDDQYMLGPSLLVAPIFSESEEPVERDLYLPHGDWYEWWTGERVQGGRYVRQAVPLEIVPLYVRAGSAIPLGPELSHVDERPVTTERLLRFPPPSDADEAQLRG